MINVICVHTTMALVEPLTKTFAELLPEVNVNHIADSSLIKEVIANNAVTPAVRRRLLAYYNAAADAGADVVFNTCSSVGDVADYGNTYARIPVADGCHSHNNLTHYIRSFVYLIDDFVDTAFFVPDDSDGTEAVKDAES